MHPSEQSAANAGALSANHLQQQLNNLNRAVEMSLLIGELQRHGLDAPNFFASLQQLVPGQCLALSSFPSEEDDGSSLSFWRWKEGMPPTKGSQAIDPDGYRALCHAPRLINSALEELAPNEMELGHAFWKEGAQSVVILPMLIQGKIRGVLHLSSSRPVAFTEQDASLLQVLADGLAPIVAFLHAEESSGNLVQHQMELANVQADAKHEIDTLRSQLEEAFIKNETLQKKVDANQRERARLNNELQHYRTERGKLGSLGEELNAAKRKMLEAGEEMRLFLLQVFQSATEVQRRAMGLYDENQNMLHAHAELVMDAASEMIPQARNLSGNLESLEDPAFGKLPSRQMKFVRASLKSGRYINRLLSQLNDYSRGLTSQIELAPEYLDLPRLYDEVHGQFLTHIHNKRQNVQANWANPLPKFVGDEYSTRQLIHGLFEHAVDATPENGNVQFDMGSSPSGGISIRLVHESENLTDEELANIFIPFQRPDFDPDDDIPPGLSLALVRQYVRVQQGQISVEQHDGKLHFSIELPLNVSPQVPPATRTELSVEGLIMPSLPEEFTQPFGLSFDFPEIPVFHPITESSMELPVEEEVEVESSFASIGNAPAARSSVSNPSAPAPPSFGSSPAMPKPTTQSFASNPAAPAAPPSYSSRPSAPAAPPSFSSAPSLSAPEPMVIEPIDEVELTDEDLFELAAEEPKPLPPPPASSASLQALAARDSGSFSSFPEPPPLSPDAPTSHASVPSLPPAPPSLGRERPLSSPALTPPPLPAMTPPAAQLQTVPPSQSNLEMPGMIMEELPPGPSPSHDSLIIETITPSGTSETLSSKSHLPTNITPPTLLCLAGENEEPQDMIFEDFEVGGFQLALAPMELNILDGVTEDQRPTVLLLYTNTPGTNFDPMISHMWSQPSTATMPMLSSVAIPNQEKHFQLYWNNTHSQLQTETFWRQWLQKLGKHQRGAEYNLLSIGMDPDSMGLYPLLQFLSGPRLHIQSELNPAQGVQLLWKDPPDLLSVYLDSGDLGHWLPMFDEMSRSGRTVDIPLLIFSEYPINESIQKALTPLNFLYFQPAN